jgi:hypothetical protein
MKVRSLHLDDATESRLEFEHVDHIGTALSVLERRRRALDHRGVLIKRQIGVARAVEEVFEFVSDPERGGLPDAQIPCAKPPTPSAPGRMGCFVPR